MKFDRSERPGGRAEVFESFGEESWVRGGESLTCFVGEAEWEVK